MTTAIQRWGNSQGICLPTTLLEALNWSLGEKINIVRQDNRLIIEPLAPSPTTIQELFAGYDGEYEPQEIDWGCPVGREVW